MAYFFNHVECTRGLVCSSIVLCCVSIQAQLIAPVAAAVTLGGSQYQITFASRLMGTDHGRLLSVAAESLCGSGDISGRIVVSADLSLLKQAKAMIHETVHIAQTCDKRDLPVEERIAQDIADLLNGPEGGFILKELK